VALACLVPGLSLAASLTGSNVVSSATVNLSTVGTLDWARWPGYSHKSNLISNVTTTGTLKTYSTDPRLIGTNEGIKVGGTGASFAFTVAATTTERTLTYYIGGWNSTGRVTVTLTGAPTYTTTVSSSTTFSRVITVKFRADSAATLRVTYAQTGGSGSIKMQAAALSQPTVSAPTTGSAILTWQPPALNTDGSTLTDLAAFKIYWGTTQGTYSQSTKISNAAARTYTVPGLTKGTWYFVVTALNEDGSALADLAAFKLYWGTTPGTYSQSTKISNAAARTYTVSGLTKGTWYFVVTALNSKGVESPYSNVWSKTVP